jgi:hypothetical protein
MKEQIEVAEANKMKYLDIFSIAAINFAGRIHSL